MQSLGSFIAGGRHACSVPHPCGRGRTLSGTIDRLDEAVGGWIEASPGRPLLLGLCGAQGSGKSTLAARLAARLGARGQRAAILSLDDLYLPRAERARLARDVHPLLATRGVPLTHDV